jgi:hypothetical protein
VKKFLLIFLLMLLPFQGSWAAAAAYCPHEGERTAQHFGHQHAAQASAADDTGPVDQGQHGDCSYCHLSCQAAFVTAALPLTATDGVTYFAARPYFYSSPIPDGPKRPDRHLVA